mgnify:CR=1 FL=1
MRKIYTILTVSITLLIASCGSEDIELNKNNFTALGKCYEENAFKVADLWSLLFIKYSLTCNLI